MSILYFLLPFSCWKYSTPPYLTFHDLKVHIRCMTENRGSKKMWMFVALSIFCFWTPSILIIGLSFLDNFVLVNYNIKRECCCTGLIIVIFSWFQLLITRRSFLFPVFWWHISGGWRNAEDQAWKIFCPNSYAGLFLWQLELKNLSVLLNNLFN